MDKVLNVFSRLKQIWTAVKTPTPAEQARRDSINDGQSIVYEHHGPSPELQQFRMLVGSE